ncbi:RagB/SusD family nutrient uptake outer membrane protein [Portibacter lacus]|nr:RagB/SusD family nutrient uptake outer membrane protein [Portibacter lacus]
MKKSLYIKSIWILSILMLSNCSYLDVVPDDVATLDDAFANRSAAEGFLASCYAYLPQYGDPWINPGLLAGDEVWLNEEQTNVEGQLIAKGFQSSNAPYLSFWDGHFRGKNMYVGIRNCNIFLERIDQVQDIGNTEKQRWISEVLFLKAYYHFWLFKSYGPIPVIKENLDIYADTKEAQVFREPVDDVVNYIVELIDEAVDNLPLILNSEIIELGHITKPIALAIKARVLATAASPLFNGNTNYANIVDARGVSLFPATEDPSKWVKAAEAAKEAIEVAEMANISLINKYESKSDIDSIQEFELITRSVCTERNNQEVIWASTHFTFSQTYQRMLVPLLIPVTASNPTSQFYAPSMRMAELFYSANGVPIEEDLSFDFNNRFKLRTAEGKDSRFIQAGQQTAALHFDREPRFYGNIAFDRGTYFLDPNNYTVQIRAGELASKRNRGEFSATGYLVKKLIHPKSALNESSFNVYYNFPFPIMRLADLYLLYAEALNESKGAPDDEVYEYIDRIRERSGLEGVVTSWENHSTSPDKPKTKEGMREIIHQERLIELAFEGQRFWDLRRWKKSIKYMNEPIRGWNIGGSGLSFYNVNTLFTPTFTSKDYLWPIPLQEIINNPNLVQNVGW